MCPLKKTNQTNLKLYELYTLMYSNRRTSQVCSPDIEIANLNEILLNPR